MARYASPQMGFPRFRGGVRNLILITAAVYGLILLGRAFAPGLAEAILSFGALSPAGIERHYFWQFLTYGFIDWDPLGFLFSMMAVYFLGAAVEAQTGSRSFVELYLFSLVGAGIGGYLFFLARIGGGIALGAGAAVNAILMVFFLLNRHAPVVIIPIPIPIPVKYIVLFTAVVEGAYFLIQRSLSYLVLLLGLGMGYVWYRFLWRRSMAGILAGQAVLLRNSYYRWKRERAKRKFQVYMREHAQDPKQYFDEYGNFRPPSERDKKDDRGSGGWVN